MKKSLFVISLSLIIMMMGCEKRGDTHQNNTNIQAGISPTSNDRQQSDQSQCNDDVVDKQILSGQEMSSNSMESHAYKPEDTVANGLNADDKVESREFQSMHTIKDEAEPVGREIDNFEEQMNRLQAAVERLLED